MSSFRARIFRAASRAVAGRIDITTVDFVEMRERINRIGARLSPAKGVRVDADEINGLHSEWLTPEHCADGKLLLYLHGGAYIVGGCDMHRQMVSHIAKAAQVRALLPEYRLAPENKFPAAIEDAVGVYRTLLDMGIKPDNIVIAGDSAGGGLTVGTLIKLRDAGDPMPAAAVLLSPFLDTTASGESMQTRKDRDPLFDPEQVPFVVDQYCAPDQRRLPEISPVFADVEGLPPMLIQVGDEEILLSDSERMDSRLRAAGIPVELQVWPEMWHVFQIFVGKMPEANLAVQKIGDYIRSQLGISET